MAGTLQLDVGCDFRFTAPASVAGVFQVEPTRDARHRLLSETLTTTRCSPGGPTRTRSATPARG